MMLCRNLLAVYIQLISNVLKGKEGDAHRQYDVKIGDVEIRQEGDSIEQEIQRITEEIEIFKIE